MNRVGSLFSEGYNLISSGINAASQLVELTTSVTKDVFLDTAPHLLSVSSMYFSNTTSLRGLSLFANIKIWWDVANAYIDKKDDHNRAIENHKYYCGLVDKFKITDNKDIFIIKREHFKKLCDDCEKQKISWIPLAISSAQMATKLADEIGLIPRTVECRVAVESLYVLSSVMGSYFAIKEGTNRILSIRNSEKTKDKISGLISGVIMTSFGSISLGSAYARSLMLAETLKLNPSEAALKHRFVASPDEKKCRGVFIDGREDRRIGKIPSPFAQALNENCETLFYSDIKLDKQFCEVMSEAETVLGGKIDILAIFSHGDNTALYFDNGYTFTGKHIECINENLAPEAQVFLLGCNTATPLINSEEKSLIDNVAQTLPKKEITGFNAYYGSLLTISNYVKGHFQHDAYFFLSLNGFINPFQTSAVTKVSNPAPTSSFFGYFKSPF